MKMNDKNNILSNNIKSLFPTIKLQVMKNFLITISFLFIAGILSAQVKIGLRASSPSISSKEASKEYFIPETGTLLDVNYLSTRTSYAYGLGFYKDVGNAFIGADILYRKKTVHFEVDETSVRTRGANLYEDKFQEITIPIVAGWRKNNLKLGLGPVFTFKADSEYSLATMNGITVSERKIDTGFQFLLGYIIKDRIHIDLKRELNFNQAGDDYKVKDRQMNLKNLPHTASISVGVFF